MSDVSQVKFDVSLTSGAVSVASVWRRDAVAWAVGPPNRGSIGSVGVVEPGPDQERSQVLVGHPQQHPADVHVRGALGGQLQLSRRELVVTGLSADQVVVEGL